MLRVVVAPPGSDVEARIIDHRERGGKVMVIGSEHSLDVIAMSVAAASRGMNPQEALRGVYISRAFNMFQAENLMSETGPTAAVDFRASAFFAIDLHDLFLVDGDFSENARRFAQSVWQMKHKTRDITCELVFKSVGDKGSKGFLGSALSAADEFEELKPVSSPSGLFPPLSSAPLSPSLKVLMR